jgi:hypothetical protein
MRDTLPFGKALLTQQGLIAVTGQEINGKDLNAILGGSINNRNEVAFKARYTDGTEAVVLAVPIPEPSAMILMMMALLGLMSNARAHRRGLEGGHAPRQVTLGPSRADRRSRTNSE